MLRQLINNLQNSFATLSSRERRLVMVAGVALSVFVVFLVTWNFSSSAEAIRKRTQNKIARLEEVQQAMPRRMRRQVEQDGGNRRRAS